MAYPFAPGQRVYLDHSKEVEIVRQWSRESSEIRFPDGEHKVTHVAQTSRLTAIPAPAERTETEGSLSGAAVNPSAVPTRAGTAASYRDPDDRPARRDSAA